MHIVQVEIDNFKSFSRKTKIPFFEGYTVISGPNGSGKSNIIDSILFVLSLTSSRTLRAEKMTDFINNTSGKNIAEVTLTFSDDTKIRRRIKQSSPTNYYSYYYLNEKTSSQAEIIDWLSKAGIRPHGYNVVMQGDISRIMDMSDMDRRKIIDEIAGVSEFDRKKEQANQELDQVRAKIEREEMILAQYAEQLQELAGAKEDAVKYKNLKNDLDYFNAAKQMVTLKDKEREAGLLATSREEQVLQKEKFAEDIRLEENERDARIEELEELDKQIAEKQGPGYLKLIEKQTEQRTIIGTAEGTISRLRKDKESNLAQMNTIYVEQQKYQDLFSESTKKVQKLNIDRANLAMEVEGLKKTLDKAQELVTKRTKDSSGAEAKLVELGAQVENLKNERGEIYRERDRIIDQSRTRERELEKLTGDKAYFESERVEKQKEIEKLEGELRDVSEERNVFGKQIAAAERKMADSRNELERVREERSRLEKRQAVLAAQQKAVGGSDDAIKAVSGIDGVYGTVAELGKVLNAGHTIALNVAAGGRLRNVVVNNDQTGANAINYLKSENLGRLTFLPLNKMKPQAALPPLAGNGVIDYAINLIDFEPEFRDVFSLVFGQTVIVETLDAGRRLMGRYRMVTLDGDLLEKGGAMTGGSQTKAMQKGFGAAPGRETSDIAAKLAELSQDEEDLKALVARNQAVVDGLRKEKGEFDTKITQIELAIKECNRVIDKVESDEVQAKALLEATEKDKKECAVQVSELEAKGDELSDKIEELNKQIGELRSATNAEEFKLLTEELTAAQKNYNAARVRLDTKQNELNGENLERNFHKKNVEDKNRERALIEEKNKAIEDEIAKLHSDIEQANAALSALEQELSSFQGEIAGLNAQRKSVDQSVTEAKIRIEKLNGDVERCELQIAAIDEKTAAISKEIAEIRGSIDGEIECDLTSEEILDKIATTERAIRRLGDVNMQAIDQYDDLLKRTEEKTEKKNTLSREREDLLAKIESFRQMKHDAFMEAYNSIAENFSSIYLRLNEGEGRLVLDVPEDPFQGGMTFEVSPRGKEVHRLNMMSGGEKSLTTLSFIFAIQQYMPAPFYALDEVDSNLDGLNVEHLSHMVREICENSQFIIVSHRKPMIEAADRMMGVTVRASDKSTLVTGVKTNNDRD
ncbi:MAG TPA: chromosome segregation protein SMC [Methanocorpusculum sp.]|nr:chromosome segregation protein SMC [Methanocorpusculum sp.]